MRAGQRFLLMMASLMLLSALVLVFTGTAARPDLVLVRAAPAATPPCLTHTTSMTLSTSNTAPKVGETILVTSTLTNEGCSLVGLPQYRLYTQSSHSPPVLVPNPPEPITHILGIGPGQSDSAEFFLQVIGSGQVTLTSLSSFEVHLGYPGPAYWAGDSTGPLAITVPTTDTEVLVLQQAACEIGCFPDILIEDATYHFDCMLAAGHSAHAQLQRFPDESKALAAFEVARDTLAPQYFHCYPAYEWPGEQEAMRERQQGQSWVADRWIVTTRSLDDTNIPVAPPPGEISEAIYRAAKMNRLFEACDVFYLPLVPRSH